jgi:hypothetical protein
MRVDFRLIISHASITAAKLACQCLAARRIGNVLALPDESVVVRISRAYSVTYGLRLVTPAFVPSHLSSDQIRSIHNYLRTRRAVIILRDTALKKANECRTKTNP